MTHEHTNAKLRSALAYVLALVAAYAASFASDTAHAQLGDQKIASAGYEYYPYATSKQTSINPGGEDTAFQSFKATLQVPIKLSNRTVFLPGFRYSVLDVIPREAGDTNGQVDALHAMMLRAGIYHQFNDTWAIYAAVSGGLASDFAGDLSSQDLVFAGQLIGMWTIVPEFTLGLGIGYDRRTGTVSPLPLIALDWQPSEVFMIRGVVPESLAARYRAAKWLTLSVEGALEGERYHLSERLGEDEAEVASSMIKAGLGATVHWNAWCHTRLYGGAAMARRFEVYVEDESQGDLKVEAGPFAGLELVVGPSGWKADAKQQ